MQWPLSKKGGANSSVYMSSAPVWRSVPEGDSEVYAKLTDLQNNLANSPKFDRNEHMDKKRAIIALIFVWGYLFLVFVILVGVPLYNNWIGQPVQLDADKTFTEVGTLLGTPLGFVVGYYFKEDRKK